MLDLERVLREATMEVKGGFGPREGKLFPSDLGFRGCKRAFWYKLRDEPTDPPSEEGRLKMLMGDHLEDMVADLLTRLLPKHGYRVVERGTYVPVPGTTGGKVDILVESLETGLQKVIEVKSVDGKAKRYLPKKPHMLQTQAYMRSLDVEEGYLVYVFRDVDSTPMVFTVPRNDDAVASAVNDLNALAEGPEPPATEVAWQRKYCDLKNCRCTGA